MVCDDSIVGLGAVPPADGESTKSDVVETMAAARLAVIKVDAWENVVRTFDGTPDGKTDANADEVAEVADDIAEEGSAGGATGAREITGMSTPAIKAA